MCLQRNLFGPLLAISSLIAVHAIMPLPLSMQSDQCNLVDQKEAGEFHVVVGEVEYPLMPGKGHRMPTAAINCATYSAAPASAGRW
ncbi:hypothetical protein TQ38_025320 [Novosphingobium sp. P6W]|nr:hypothetical protein TQ38_025320 [Novosphingobium sp. P6W]